jgi:amino acid transporter
MSFFDIFNMFSDTSSMMGNKESRTRQPRIYILFDTLLALSILLLAIELKSILNLSFLFLFLTISIVVGFILTVVTILLIFRFELIDFLRTKDFFTILIPITFLVISLASIVIR